MHYHILSCMIDMLSIFGETYILHKLPTSIHGELHQFRMLLRWASALDQGISGYYHGLSAFIPRVSAATAAGKLGAVPQREPFQTGLRDVWKLTLMISELRNGIFERWFLIWTLTLENSANHSRMIVMSWLCAGWWLLCSKSNVIAPPTIYSRTAVARG